MRIVKIIIHSLFLALTNLTAIVIGYIVYYFFKQVNQSLLQIPIAFIFSLMIFIIWIWIIKRNNIIRLMPIKIIDYIFILIGSMIWIPAIFYPLHYLTQHYPSSFKNIVWVWIFQIPTNILILLISYWIMKGIHERGQSFFK